METEPEPSTSPASNCRWVILSRYGYCRDSDDASADAKASASAEARTSAGRLFHVSFAAVPPPASSSFYYDWAGGGAGGFFSDPSLASIVAANGDCAVIELQVSTSTSRRSAAFDYFVYDADAGAAARPPSLALLPARRFPMQHERGRTGCRLRLHDTGLLRRGGGDDGGILVAQLEVCYDYGDRPPEAPCPDRRPRGTAELCLLHYPGGREWEIKRDMPIVVAGDNKQASSSSSRHLDDDLGEDLRSWDADAAAVAVGGRFLCWVNYPSVLLVWDTAADEGSAAASGELLYLRLPARGPDVRPHTRASRSMSAAGTAAVRLVSVDLHRHCSTTSSDCDPGNRRCAFTVRTWTLSLTPPPPPATWVEECVLDCEELWLRALPGYEAPPATWVEECVLDCEELWALPGYEGLPFVPVEYPMACSDDDPHVVVCFMIRNDYQRYIDRSDRRAWMIEVDMRKKTLRSVVPCTGEERPEYHVPLKLQY